MGMPGRKYTAGNGYRYGFNGKENDNEVKGEGNQQDYGMRIYDPRLGRFLSTDPLIAKYPFYSPYQFSGNDVIRCIDLDGGEPKARTEKWDKSTVFISKTNYSYVYDKTSNRAFSLQGVVDPVTNKIWIVADDDQGQHQYFYLVNDDGSTDRLRTYVDNGRTTLYKSHLEKFETRNEIDKKQGNQIANGFSYMAAAIGAAPLIFELGAAATSDAGIAYLTEKTKDAAVDLTGQIIANNGQISKVDLADVAANYLPLPKVLTQVIQASVDGNVKDGFTFIGGNGENKKSFNSALIDFGVAKLGGAGTGKIEKDAMGLIKNNPNLASTTKKAVENIIKVINSATITTATESVKEITHVE